MDEGSRPSLPVDEPGVWTVGRSGGGIVIESDRGVDRLRNGDSRRSGVN